MKFAPLTLKDMWLSTVNPLRGLTMSRVVAELEAGERGDYSMLQWLYRFLEKRDATLRGAKRRLRSAVLKLDWKVKVLANLSAEQQALADKQQAVLTAAYERIENFRAALGHLVLSEFRGFSHLEKHYDEEGNVFRFEPVPQWHWCRDGLYGAWQFKEDASRGGVSGEPIDPRHFIIREVEDPINEIAAPAITRKGLSDKDWDGFIARYGIPFVYWILGDAMAQTVASDPTKLNELLAIMRGIGADGEGVFPGGSLQTLESSGASGEAFAQHLKHQDEKIVMAATSGKLTMLNEATGLGSGNSEAHSDTFDEIALALAMEISETFQSQFDKLELNRAFPNQPHLVYFELAARDEEDISQVTKNAKELSEAGFQMDASELSERTGYKLTLKPIAGAPLLPTGKNRAIPPRPKKEDDDAAIRQAAAGLLRGFSGLSSQLLSLPPADDLDPLWVQAVVTGAQSAN